MVNLASRICACAIKENLNFMSYLKDEELLHSTHNRRLQPLEFLNVDFDGTGNRD